MVQEKGWDGIPPETGLEKEVLPCPPWGFSLKGLSPRGTPNFPGVRVRVRASAFFLSSSKGDTVEMSPLPSSPPGTLVPGSHDQRGGLLNLGVLSVTIVNLYGNRSGTARTARTAQPSLASRYAYIHEGRRKLSKHCYIPLVQLHSPLSSGKKREL